VLCERDFSCEDSDGTNCGREREEAYRRDHRVDVRASASRVRGAARRFRFRCGVVAPEGSGSEEGACSGEWIR